MSVPWGTEPKGLEVPVAQGCPQAQRPEDPSVVVSTTSMGRRLRNTG